MKRWMAMTLAAAAALTSGAVDVLAQQKGKPTALRTLTWARKVSDLAMPSDPAVDAYGNPIGPAPAYPTPLPDSVVPLDNGNSPMGSDGMPLGVPLDAPPLVTGTLRMTRLDLPYPDEAAPPRKSMIEVRVPPDGRAYIDGHEMECRAGVYRFAPKDPLYPTVPYIHNIYVERFAEDGTVRARTVTIYMRMGRLTLLTFE